MITLKDIAKEAKVSVMTVSRVVNGNYSKVSAETADRIKKIIEEKGYVPNHSARSLISKQSNIIAIIMREGSSPDDPYNSKMLASIIPRLQNHGYYAMVACLDDFQAVNRHLRAWNAAGAIFLGLFEEEVSKINENNNIPLIFTDNSRHVDRASNIVIDDYKGGVLAAEHFIEHGHTKFGFVGCSIDYSPTVKARLDGYRDTLLNNGLELRDEHIFTDSSEDKLTSAIMDKVNDITALFVSADILALNIIDQLKIAGYSIPEDLSFVGFDNLPLSYYVTPKLTTIAQDIDKKAKVACDMLLRHIKDHKLPSEKQVLTVKLISRESVKTISSAQS